MSNSGFTRAFRNIKRSTFRSITVIFMMTITFFMLGILLFVMFVSQNLITYFIQAAEVIGYFKEEVTEEQILDVKKEFETLEYVAGVTYISKEDAMQSFIESNEDNKDIIESVTVNPFPAHLNVKTNDLAKAPDIAQKFNENDLILEVDDLESVQGTLQRIVRAIEVISLGLLFIFSISTIFVIFLATGITIYSQKNELKVMKIVGATNWYITSPFFFQSIIYAFVSVFFSSVIIITILVTQYEKLMNLLFEGLQMPALSPEILAIGILIQVLFAFFLACTSSYFATRRYINI